MLLHPVLQAMLDKAAGQPTIDMLPLDTVRAAYLERMASIPRPDVASVEDRLVAGPRGDIGIRIYRPTADGGHPVVVFFHGGGFAICGIETHDGLCREICVRSGMVVVSVGYALAPEHKFPAATDDCLAATRWIARNAAEFGGDASRLAVAGDSAGGNLAAVTALRVRDESGPAIQAQLLLYPVTDFHTPATASYVAYRSGVGLTGDVMRWFWGLYLTDPREADHPHVAPNRAARLDGLPPAYIVTAGHDPLRDEGLAYAARLRAAGVEVDCIDYPDMNHGFLSWTTLVDRADAALEAACAWLRGRM